MSDTGGKVVLISSPDAMQRLHGLQGPFPSPHAPRETQVALKPASGCGLAVLLAVGLAFMTAGIGWTVMLLMDKGEFWFVWIFVAVFELVGLVIVGIGVAQLLARRKVEPPELVVSVQPLYLGETFTVRLRQPFKGDCQLNGVALKLICREEATYRRGTNTHTDRHEVFSESYPVFEAQHAPAGTVLESEVSLQIPEDAMHTFVALRNKILWFLEVHVDIAAWPDYREEFQLQVAPRRVESAA